MMKPLPKPVAEAKPPAPTLPPLILPPSAVIPPPISSNTAIPPVTLPQPKIPLQPANIDQAHALLQQLLPTKIKDRNGWRNDILSAFTGLKIPYEAQYFCAAIAIIEQESSWQSDPTVANLDKIVWKEIEKRADKYHLPMLAVKLALLKPSADGRSYKTRIDALKTEKQMNALFEDMVADAGKIGLPFEMKNPIRTGGPMQVSIDFAESQIRAWPYPYSYKGSLRNEVFTRRGGLYFGIANLLQYRVNYPQMKYRFADFNAGRYSSRNAAFQAALSILAHKKMGLDGDLLMYQNNQTSTTQQQLIKLAARLDMTTQAIERDLKLEKSEAFSQTRLFKRVFELAKQQTGRDLAQQVTPQIQLVSPKITRKLTTEWFAGRVDGRYKTCMGRQPNIVKLP
ncbi:DUF1615 domain-containing protein [Moraxellaceae bacterium AER2_44_116]|nr:DUF1615 domain-containing protein [Moraxellaceae bacterium AER2_44_116]